MKRTLPIVLVVLLMTAACAAAEPCDPLSRGFVPDAAELAGLCPAERAFAAAPWEQGLPGGCELYFRGEQKGSSVVVGVWHEPKREGGAKAAAAKAAFEVAKINQEDPLPVMPMPWKSVEAYRTQDDPAAYVQAGETQLKVYVIGVLMDAPADACIEAITAAAAARAAEKK